MKSRVRKAIIVNSDVGADLEARLASAGWRVLRVCDGSSAIAKVRQECFDLALLVATGGEMDITETLFNLNDIRPEMPIVVVGQSEETYGVLSQPLSRLDRGKMFAVQDFDALMSVLGSRDLHGARPSTTIGPQA